MRTRQQEITELLKQKKPTDGPRSAATRAIASGTNRLYSETYSGGRESDGSTIISYNWVNNHAYNLPQTTLL